MLSVAACGVPGGPSDRAAVLARTCSYYLVRLGLAEPGVDGDLAVDSLKFEIAFARALESGEPFSSIDPLRTTCRTIATERRSMTNSTSTEPPAADVTDD